MTNEFSDRSKIIINSAFNLANKHETKLTSPHILYIFLVYSGEYISDILISLTSNFEGLKTDIFSLLNKYKKLGNIQEVYKNVVSLINTSKMLLKQFDDQIITQEILLLSFTLINDPTKEVLSKYNITYNTLLEEIKKFRKGKKL